MSARLYLTVYEPDNLPTSDAEVTSLSIGTVDEASELSYRSELHGTGEGKVKINRHHPQAALLVADNYVLVHSDAGVVGGFFLEEAPIDLSAENGPGDEWMEWSGRGPLAILDRAVMDADSNISGGQDPIDGSWDLSNQGAAAGDSSAHPIPMLKRALVEAQLQTPDGIAVVDHSSWTYDSDTNGATPPLDLQGVFSVNVGDSILDVLARVDQLGTALFRMSYLFKLDAFLTYGTDRSGAFGADTVRFEKGVNIAASIRRKIRGAVNVTHMIVGGTDATYVTVVDPDYTAGDVVRWGYLSMPETSDSGQLSAAGLANIAARKRQTDTFVLPQHDHGNVPASGIYEPGPTGHYWVGDTVTHHTGTGTYDANEQDSPVAAITWELKNGSEANGDYWVTPEVGSTFYWTGRQAIDNTSGGSSGPTLRLCDPAQDGCEDVTATLAPDDFDCEQAPSIAGHWYQGGVDPNPLTTGAQHGGTGYYTFHSLSNPWAGYHFSGTWQAGTEYTVGFWTRVNAAPCTFTLGAVTGVRTFGADKVTLTVAAPEADWTYHELVWTPGTTVTSDGVFSHNGVALDMAFAASSTTGVDFDDGSVCVATSSNPLNGNQPCAARGDHTHTVITDRAPMADDDLDAGYRAGSSWYDTSTNVYYVLIDDTAGAAIWESVGGGTYTDEQAQDAVGAMLADTATVNLTYTDATPELKADVIPSGIKLDDLGAPDDNTDLNASTSKHGLLRKLSGTATEYLDGSGAWSTPAGGGAAALDDLTDVTITSPAVADRLRYDGSAWVNSALIWRPAMTFDGTNWQVAVDGAGNAVMTEA